MDLAIRIVNLYKYLTETKKEYVLSKQLLRAGTSIGANIAEAKYTQSDMDFINKYSIARKESNETLYWITLLFKTEYLNKDGCQSIYKDVEEIQKMLTASIKTLKKKVEQKIQKKK